MNISSDNVRDHVIHSPSLVVIHSSDVHISQESHKSISNWKTFIEQRVPDIHPDLVIVSGDLVHAKHSSKYFGEYSEQRENEWIAYKTILEKNQSHRLLQIRGNHDVLDVYNRSSSKNGFHFNHHTITVDHIYMNTNTQSTNTVLFLGLDACPEPGLVRNSAEFLNDMLRSCCFLSFGFNYLADFISFCFCINFRIFH